MPEDDLSSRLARVERYLERSVDRSDDKLIERIDTLLGQSKKYRTTIKDLRSQNAKLEEDLKKAGESVVGEEDAKLLDQYKQLGSIEDVKKSIQSGGDAAAKIKKLERSEELRNVASAYGWNAGALIEIDSLSGSPVEIKAVESGSGAQKTTTFVAVVDGKDVPYEQYLKDTHPALVAALGSEESIGKPPSFPRQRVTGTPPPNGNRSDEDYANDQSERLATATML